MEKNLNREEIPLPEPKWWGVTIGSLLYAVRANSGSEARVRALRALGVVPEENIVPTFTELYEDEHQPDLDNKAAETDAQLMRLIPFSTAPWPEDANNLTPEQQAALDFIQPKGPALGGTEAT